ncbi:hypothetical protein DSO57_1016232 [Entomophthora muscae]|uniref:Uncharacterized protein n=1 Tax=Entomophthora muscae TaxID=34485 RepID=A0ACC2RJI4_9FUNG|nr:hypothetical protein DSO57_1016232 [Entomophthora muscae]
MKFELVILGLVYGAPMDNEPRKRGDIIGLLGAGVNRASGDVKNIYRKVAIDAMNVGAFVAAGGAYVPDDEDDEDEEEEPGRISAIAKGIISLSPFSTSTKTESPSVIANSLPTQKSAYQAISNKLSSYFGDTQAQSSPEQPTAVSKTSVASPEAIPSAADSKPATPSRLDTLKSMLKPQSASADSPDVPSNPGLKAPAAAPSNPNSAKSTTSIPKPQSANAQSKPVSSRFNPDSPNFEAKASDYASSKLDSLKSTAASVLKPDYLPSLPTPFSADSKQSAPPKQGVLKSSFPSLTKPEESTSAFGFPKSLNPFS